MFQDPNNGSGCMLMSSGPHGVSLQDGKDSSHGKLDYSSEIRPAALHGEVCRSILHRPGSSPRSRVSSNTMTSSYEESVCVCVDTTPSELLFQSMCRVDLCLFEPLVNTAVCMSVLER